MRKSLIAVLALALMVWAGNAFAVQCPTGQSLKKIGNIQTAGDAVITTQGWDVALVTISCSSSACIAGLYDGAVLASDATTANVVFEPTAPASQGAVYDFTGGPLYFKTGILFHQDGNVKAVGCYACQQR